MSTLIWAQEILVAIKKASSVVSKLAQEANHEAQSDRERLQSIVQSLKMVYGKVWEGDDDVFELS
jgi:hypothetical protein